ncbi:phage major capsid protein [Rhodococcus sp. IEGM 1302]|uniref:phage major capsid protein n=1 Tax=Rhodococcus sp. IEGM 1302 TaxID=3047093 RepID=UPI0024B6761F|nr:phage major capsid protein [Rhodococcus sp. IEGM 1302]MDI9943260.1 phage major capsid protein [Rhodococcus sp. IEGM 1302]
MIDIKDPRWAKYHGLPEAQVAAEAQKIRAEAHELAERSELQGADADRFEELADTLEYFKIRSESRARMLSLADAGGHIEAGASFDGPKRKDTDPTRDAALSNVERSHKAGRLTDAAAALSEKLIGSESIAARLAATTGSDAYRSAFAKLVVNPERGHLLWTPQESEAYRNAESVRSIISGSSGTGKHLVPWDLDPAVILTSAGSVSPLREISRVVTTSSNQWNGVSSAGVTAEWLAETAEAADASPSFAPEPVPLFKSSAWIEFSFEAEEDALGLLSELQRLLADGALELENAALVNGNGTTQPTGIVTSLVAAGGSVIVPGSGTEALAAADLYNLQNALGPRFQPNASFAANLATINTIRQFETGSGALKFPSAQNVPATLLGRPLHEVSNIDGTLNPAATESNYVAIYGDFGNFVIVDKLGSTVELVPQVFGPNRRPTGQRGLLLHRRIGSDVVNPAAFKLLRINTTA